MALSRHHAAVTRPMNVEEIVQQAEDFDYSSDRELRAWLRSARLLLTEASSSEQDGNLQTAYLYLYRHAHLVIRKLPDHPQAKDAKLRADLEQANGAVIKNLAKMEKWKPRINQEYQRYVKAMERRNAEKQRIHDEHRESGLSEFTNDRPSRPSLDGGEDSYHDKRATLDASQHKQLAVSLAQHELRRRDVNRQTTRQAGISPGTVASRRKGLVMGPTDPSATPADERNDGDQVSQGIRQAGSYLQQRGTESRGRRTHQGSASQSYNYPAVPAKESAMCWSTPTLQPSARQLPGGPPPALPAKESVYGDAPPRPAKQALTPDAPSPPNQLQNEASKVTFKPNAFTEAGAPLRTVFLPPTLRTTFLNLAHKNTLKNLETCGILCGTVVSNALFINHLVIPDQKSTSDTCDTTEEGDNALFDYCDGNELLVCGWIHTHPSQTCFLSSRDLHTSSGYQVMLPESIAIVCAPRHNPDWGIFRLTDPPGLPAVLNCHQSGLFHPHSESNLYTDALRPGHVVEGDGLKFQVVDMRLPK